MEEEVIFKIDIPAESITSIENLTKSSKALREERKKLNLETAEGKKRANEINQQLDANTEIIKKNSSALEKQRLNVGNYTGALDKMVPGLGATAAGFQGMAKSALAFIATPIGAVIGALGLILSGVTKFLTGTARGQDELNKLMAIGAAVTGKLSDALIYLGEHSIGLLIKGWEKQLDIMRKVIPGFGILLDYVKKLADEAAKDPIELANLKNKNDQLERELIVNRAKLQVKIAENKLRAEDKSLDLQTRNKLLEDAIGFQKDLSKQEQEFADNKLKIVQLTNAQSESNKQDKKAEAEAEAELILIRKESADKQTELFTKQQAIREETTRGLEAERDAIVAAANEENIREGNKVLAAAAQEERHQRELEQINERIQAYVSEEEIMRRRIANLDLEADFTDESVEANADYNDELKQSAKNKAEDARNTAVLMSSINQMTGALKQSSIAQKTVASGQALVNTYLGATNALTAKPPLPFPLNLIALAATVASGLSTVAKINGVGFADSGLVPGFASSGLSGTRIMPHHGRPIKRSNGDNLLATVKTGEVILNERHQAMLGGDATFRRMGVPGFATSGFTGAISAAAQRADSGASTRAIADSIANLKLFVSVAEMREGISNVEVVESRAQAL